MGNPTLVAARWSLLAFAAAEIAAAVLAASASVVAAAAASVAVVFAAFGHPATFAYAFVVVVAVAAAEVYHLNIRCKAAHMACCTHCLQHSIAACCQVGSFVAVGTSYRHLTRSAQTNGGH